MTDDPIERLRAHVERHQHRTGLYVSTDGLTALLRQRDELKAQVEVQIDQRDDLLEGMKLLNQQNHELKTQVDRLLAKEGERIGAALVTQHSIQQKEPPQ